MIRLKAFSLVVAASVAATGSALAFSFSPAPKSFFALGTLALGNQQTSIKCDVSLKGKVNKSGVAKIDSLFFSGAQSACANTTATGLPWKTLASSATLGKIVGFGYTGAFLGTCGPGTVPFTDSASGAWTLAGSIPGGCSVNGTLNTTPPIVIVP